MKNFLKNALGFLHHYIKWICLSLLIGAVCGLVGSAFHIVLDLVTEKRLEHDFLIYLLPIGGVVIVFLYRIARQGSSHGTNDIMDAVKGGSLITLFLPPLIFVSTAITHLFGGSAGREGAALQIGGGIGSGVGRAVKLSKADMRSAILCGMSSTFTALFGTPITATIFTIEFISVGIIHYSAIFPCLIGSLAALGIAKLFNIAPTSFVLNDIPPLTLKMLLLTIVFAVACAVVSILFCKVMHGTDKLAKKIKNPYVRIIIGGVTVVLLTLFIGNRDYNGAGMDIIGLAISGEAVPYAFLLKILFTAITIGFGFKGGEIVPTFFIGATFGCVAGSLLGLPAGFCAAIGLVGMFCGVTNSPIASIFLAAELFSGEGFIFFALVSVICFILSGNIGLYESQRHLFSKSGNILCAEAEAREEYYIK